ncbi:uncharacterized protein ARB_06989 [Trichophyton benhamiae CBS 112371]|uniref:Methyltransferase n=1 Tax=Arthroderma benhamiae (strain ATCC MYA-4681 / CBS 112371) TaxID=663331 RepID=D4ARX4_ARTBC|nr:uncharacterized protein ARB_06989 [Trichophyton benhamiae CBS 112371]EFE34038.1 hypothetical protein ARB_06989 [Trichophyton benhamiae CBS 112371]
MAQTRPHGHRSPRGETSDSDIDMPDEGDIPDVDIDVSTDGQYSSLAPGEETTNAGSTKSLSEHAYQVVEENGRQYCDNTYFMPNDEREQTRLNIVHQMYLIILEGRLTKCALPQSIKRVLDVGSGPGDWALAMGDEFPNAEIIATDISVFDIQSVGICPPNVSFQIDDAQGEWTFNEPFDFIHVRGLGGGISDWSLFYQQAYQHLAPGGFIQVADSALLTGDITLPNSPPNSYLSIYLGALGSAAEMAGYPRSFNHLRSAAFEAAGFTDIRIYDTNIPVGTWPTDPQEKTLGKMTLIVLFESLEATSMRLLTKYLGWTAEEVIDLCKKVQLEILASEGMGGLVKIVVARKPQQLLRPC